MKTWDLSSLPGSVRFVVVQFLKKKGWALPIAQPVISSWHTKVVLPVVKGTMLLSVQLVVTVMNSTTYHLMTQIKKHGDGFRLVPKTWSAAEVPTPAAVVKDSEGQKIYEDEWSHYE